MASTNRTGRVSSINYAAGTYEVTYFDRGQSVTRTINAMSNGEYKMPVIGQVVSVSHTSSGLAAATTTGTVWNSTNTPAEGYKGLYRKEYASRKGQAYERYDENTGVYTQYADKRTGRTCNGEIYDEAKGPISLIAGGQLQAKSETASVSLNAKTGMGIVAGASVSIEAGGFVSIEAAGAFSMSAGGKFSAEIKKGMEVEVEGDEAKITINGVEISITKTGSLASIKTTGAISADVAGKLSLNGKKGMEIKVEGGEAKATINGAVIGVAEAGDVSVTSPTKIELAAPEINATADAGDITIQGVSLVNHTHKDSLDGDTKPPEK